MSDDPTKQADATVSGGRVRRARKGGRAADASRKASQGQPARVAFAVRALDEGKRYCAARALLMDQFGISLRTAERDLALAYAEIATEHAAELPTIAGRLSARIWRLALRCERRRDEHGALSAYAMLTKIAGLSTERVVVTGAVSPDDLAMLEALKLTPAERVQQMVKDRAALAAVNNTNEGDTNAEEED